MASGLLLIDKPSGPTSHDVVARARRVLREKRIGHAGTLDPMATGLLVLLVGQATRLSEYLTEKDKAYTATVRFGQTTDTYDAEGAILSDSGQVPERVAVEAALEGFRGPLLQQPPAYSAIKRGGQKAYELARRGEAVQLEPRPVTVRTLTLVGWTPPEATLSVTCSAGTYIRSLAHDLGQQLGCGAHLSALRRTASGEFRVDAAASLAALETGPVALRPMDEAVSDWPRLALTAAETARLINGGSVDLTPAVADGALGRAYNPAGTFIAIVRADVSAQAWRPEKVLATS
jgi:tRNA pseudouridine55 synthase